MISRSQHPRPLGILLHCLPETAAEEFLLDEYIRQECLRIQSTWSDEERIRRPHWGDMASEPRCWPTWCDWPAGRRPRSAYAKWGNGERKGVGGRHKAPSARAGGAFRPVFFDRQ